MKPILRLAIASALFVVSAFAFYIAYLFLGTWLFGVSVDAPAWLGWVFSGIWFLTFLLSYVFLLDLLLRKVRL